MPDKKCGDAEKTIDKEIMCLSNLIKRSFDAALSERGETVTPMQGHIIRYLMKNRDNDVFQKDIENYCSYRRSTASTVLGLMEEKGLIERVGVPYDARLKKIVLTKKAEDFDAACGEEHEKIKAKMTAGISDGEMEFLLGILGRIRNNLKGE